MKEIQRTSVTDAVVDSIRDMIESEQWERGEKLPPEMVLCERLKVSRTCVREAVRVLQALGYVELRPGKGAYVGDFRKKQAAGIWPGAGSVKFRDLVEVRAALESLSVRLVVERASKEPLRELEGVHQAFVLAEKRQEREHMAALDEEFFSKIASFSENPLLIHIRSLLLKESGRRFDAMFPPETVRGKTAGAQERILECFRRGDSIQAVAEVQRYFQEYMDSLEISQNSDRYGRLTPVNG